MTEQNLHTDSALSDRIKQCWREKKVPGYIGGYYYKIIDQGIDYNKEIEIPLEHFDKDLLEIINKEKPKVIERAIFRAIKELAQERFGSRDFLDRIKWRFV